MLQKLLDPFSGIQVAHQAEHIQSRYPGLSTTDQQFVLGMKTIAQKFGTNRTFQQNIYLS